MATIKVAVSGINAVDNPGPGIGVIRSLKEDKDLEVEAIGLAYDAMEPGIYMDWLVDKAFILPYPSGSEEDYISRLLYLKQTVGIDLVIPTLDTEMPLYIKAASFLETQGIKTFLPTKEQFDLRGKTKLPEVAARIGLKIPKTKIIVSYEDLMKAIQEIGLPVMVKGVFYKAYRAYTYQEATSYFHQIVAEWGYPVIVQQVVSGEEMNVIGVGDGMGESLGLVGIKKLWITALGKIWTGVTVKNDALLTAAKRFVQEFKWKGAFELECIVAKDGIYLIEINPRFPAWVYFATDIGINLPQMVVDIMQNKDIKPQLEYPQNKMYVRYTGEFVTDFTDFMKLLSTKELQND